MRTPEHKSYDVKLETWPGGRHAKPGVSDLLVLILGSSIILGLIALVAYLMYLLCRNQTCKPYPTT